MWIILNLIVFGWTVHLINKHNRLRYWPLLLLLPLIWSNPKNLVLPIIQMFGLLCLTTIKNKKVLIIITALLLAYGTAIGSRYLDFPFNVNWERTIFTNQRFEEIQEVHFKEAVFLRYKIRTVFYSNWIIGLRWLRNVATFLDIKNLYGGLGILIIFLFINIKKYSKIEMAAILIVLMAIGIGKTSDKVNGLFFSSPLWLWLISKNWPKFS